MNLRLRIALPVLLLVFCTAVSHAQNGNTSAPQSTAPPQGVTGLTIHGTNSNGQSTVVPTTPAANASGITSRLAEANQLFAQRKLPEAAVKYQEIVKADPKVAPAQVGLMRCLLMMHKVDNAQTAATAAVAALPTSPQVLTMAADVQFRLGKITESEKLYVKAENLDPKAPEPYLGLAQIYKSYSLYGRAYQNLKKAHEVAPNNPPVQLMYFHSLPHADQIPTLEAYLAKPDLNPQMARGLQGYLNALKKAAAVPAHPCKLVSNVAQTDTKLNSVARPDTRLGAVGLNVQINKQDVRLALDTGATGVLLGRSAAEKLGLQRLGYQPIMGMGDSGSQGGYTALANRIRIGNLEFQDCVVKVTDAESPVTGQDGLIGSDVFSSYLIDIDIPSAKLRLSPLPKRPNEAAQPAALQTMAQDQAEDADESSEAAKAGGLTDMPMDAYVDPSMSSWTKVYRFRSLLLVPTSVDHLGPLLFLLDTGSFSNILSTRTAQQVTALRSNPNMQVRGMSGAVSKVYTADKATLQFGRYTQDNQDVVALDLSNVSRQTGTEISGILGFRMLRILQIKIDYRDGLVDFVFDPHHLPKDIDISAGR